MLFRSLHKRRVGLHPPPPLGALPLVYTFPLLDYNPFSPVYSRLVRSEPGPKTRGGETVSTGVAEGVAARRGAGGLVKTRNGITANTNYALAA